MFLYNWKDLVLWKWNVQPDKNHITYRKIIVCTNCCMLHLSINASIIFCYLSFLRIPCIATRTNISNPWHNALKKNSWTRSLFSLGPNADIHVTIISLTSHFLNWCLESYEHYQNLHWFITVKPYIHYESMGTNLEILFYLLIYIFTSQNINFK